MAANQAIEYAPQLESTSLDYNEGTYVSHPSPKAVKVELAKLIDNPILVDRTPVLKTAFPVAWRILFTFVIQDSGGNAQPADKGLPFTVSDEGKTSSEVEPDTQTLLLTTVVDIQALLLSDDELIEESKDDVFEARDEMNEDIQQAAEE
ncbi:hypothetical protein Tco_0960275 [Tanacetum coccineum]